MRRQQQHRAVLAKDDLQPFHLLEEGVKLGILIVGLVADAGRFDLGLPLDAGLFQFRVGQKSASFALRLAGDVLGLQLPSAWYSAAFFWRSLLMRLKISSFVSGG